MTWYCRFVINEVSYPIKVESKFNINLAVLHFVHFLNGQLCFQLQRYFQSTADKKKVSDQILIKSWSPSGFEVLQWLEGSSSAMFVCRQWPWFHPKIRRCVLELVWWSGNFSVGGFFHFPFDPLYFCQTFLPFISAPPGFHDWGSVTKWTRLLITSLTAT